MARIYTDASYFANFDGQVTIWASTVAYRVGDIVNHNQLQWRCLVDNSNSEPTSSNANWAEFDFEGLGYYQFISLENIVNNFMFSSLNDTQEVTNKMIDRHEVEYWAQRGVQEFSHDVFAVQNIEYELVDSLTFPMPQNLTKIVAITFVDDFGVEQHVQPRRVSSNPDSISQEESGAIQFKQNGDVLFASDSEALRVYNENSFINQSGGGVAFGANAGSYYTYGRRYYLQPETAFNNGTYVINIEQGTVSFDSTLAGRTIICKFITDGLSENFEEIKVPKLAEDAIDAFIYYRLVRRSKANLYEKQLAEKEASRLKRNAKIRLSDYSPRSIIQAMRGKSKWIHV